MMLIELCRICKIKYAILVIATSSKIAIKLNFIGLFPDHLRFIYLNICSEAAYFYYTSPTEICTMTKPDPKTERLRLVGMLNPHPEEVQASWFQSGDFFDPRDLIQTKYEMLRHVQVEGASKAEAATLFGMSRPTFYQAEAAFARDGLPGLLPKQRGPKGAHKLTADVMALIDQHTQEDAPIRARLLAQEISTRLGLSIHPRSIERAIAARKKKL